MAPSVLQVRDLRAYYQMGIFGITREVRAVDDITLDINTNEIYGLAGESSSGKTSFIKTIAAANRAPLNVVGGSVNYSFLDRDIHSLNRSALEAVRWKNISYVMQGSMSVLNPVRRVSKTFIDFAFRHVGKPMPEFISLVEAHLERLLLKPSVLKAYPHELSGGMRQRVAIALATICRPEFIIADEPTTALDVVVQKEVLALMREIQRDMGSSILFVTHDMSVHANMADRLGIMYAGRLVEEAPTAEIFSRPLHPYTQHLIQSLPQIGDATTRKGLGGSPPSLAAPPPGCRFHPRCPIAMDRCRTQRPALTTLHAGHRVACFAAAPEVQAVPEPVEAVPA